MTSTILRAVLLGDAGCGKTTFVQRLLSSHVQSELGDAVDCVSLESSFANFTVELIDTTADLDAFHHELTSCHVVVLFYDCTSSTAFERISSHWLPELQSRSLSSKVPILVVASKIDLLQQKKNTNTEGESEILNAQSHASNLLKDYEVQKANLLQQAAGGAKNTRVVDCVMCMSRDDYASICEVFLQIQRAILFPSDRLFSRDGQLTSSYASVLRQIFRRVDIDCDGVLNDNELLLYHRYALETELTEEHITQLKSMLSSIKPHIVNDKGITMDGFLTLHQQIYSRNNCTEHPYKVLLNSGYDCNLQLEDIQELNSINQDQSVELQSTSYAFLQRIFIQFDIDKDGYLSIEEYKEAISVIDTIDLPYTDTVQQYEKGLSLENWIAYWSMWCLLEPRLCMRAMRMMGLDVEDEHTYRITKSREVSVRSGSLERDCIRVAVLDTCKTSFIRRLCRTSAKESSAIILPNNKCIVFDQVDWDRLHNIRHQIDVLCVTSPIDQLSLNRVFDFTTGNDLLPLVFLHDKSYTNNHSQNNSEINRNNTGNSNNNYTGNDNKNNTVNAQQNNSTTIINNADGQSMVMEACNKYHGVIQCKHINVNEETLPSIPRALLHTALNPPRAVRYRQEKTRMVALIGASILTTAVALFWYRASPSAMPLRLH